MNVFKDFGAYMCTFSLSVKDTLFRTHIVRRIRLLEEKKMEERQTGNVFSCPGFKLVETTIVQLDHPAGPTHSCPLRPLQTASVAPFPSTLLIFNQHNTAANQIRGNTCYIILSDPIALACVAINYNFGTQLIHRRRRVGNLIFRFAHLISLTH